MTDSLLPNDDALLFFREIVEPTVAEFMEDCANKRTGCLACLAVASLTEHYFYARPELASIGRAEFKASVRKENWSIGAIADVANATKHVLGNEQRATSNEQRGKWSYADVNIEQLNVCGVMRAGWPLGGHEVLVGPDRAWRLSELLECTMDFWRHKLGLNAEVP